MWFVRRISGFPSHGRVRDGHDLHGFMHCICQQSSFFGGDKELWTQNLFIYFCNFFDVIHSCDECKSYNGRSFKHIQPILRSTKVIEGLQDNLCMYAYGADKNRRGCWVKQIVRTKIFNLTIEIFTSPDCPRCQVQTLIILVVHRAFKFNFQRHFASPLAYETLINPQNLRLHE